MVNKIISTGIPEVDSLLGGGLLDDGTLLIVYGTRSYGWTLGIEIFRRLVSRGGFGVVINYSFPFLLLERYANVIGYNLTEDGLRGDVAVIDVFGSIYDIKVDRPFVYNIPSLDSVTFLDKMVKTYDLILKTVAGNRKPIGISTTVDGIVGLFGEDAAMKILEKNLALKMKAREIRGEKLRPINILLLYKEWIPHRFEAWLAQYAEHIIEFCPTERIGVERMVVRKSLLPEFTPAESTFKFSKGRFEIKAKSAR